MDSHQPERALDEKRKGVKDLVSRQKQWTEFERNHTILLKDVMARLEQPAAHQRRPLFNEDLMNLRTWIGECAAQRLEAQSRFFVAGAKVTACQNKADVSAAIVNALLSKFSEQTAKKDAN